MKHRLPRKQKKRIKRRLKHPNSPFNLMLLKVIAKTGMAYAYDPNYRPAENPHRSTWKLINLSKHYGAGPQALYNS